MAPPCTSNPGKISLLKKVGIVSWAKQAFWEHYKRSSVHLNFRMPTMRIWVLSDKSWNLEPFSSKAFWCHLASVEELLLLTTLAARARETRWKGNWARSWSPDFKSALPVVSTVTLDKSPHQVSTSNWGSLGFPQTLKVGTGLVLTFCGSKSYLWNALVQLQPLVYYLYDCQILCRAYTQWKIS